MSYPIWQTTIYKSARIPAVLLTGGVSLLPVGIGFYGPVFVGYCGVVAAHLFLEMV